MNWNEFYELVGKTLRVKHGDVSIYEKTQDDRYTLRSLGEARVNGDYRMVYSGYNGGEFDVVVEHIDPRDFSLHGEAYKPMEWILSGQPILGRAYLGF